MTNPEFRSFTTNEIIAARQLMDAVLEMLKTPCGDCPARQWLIRDATCSGPHCSALLRPLKARWSKTVLSF
jgi:hypothetical protein